MTFTVSLGLPAPRFTLFCSTALPLLFLFTFLPFISFISSAYYCIYLNLNFLYLPPSFPFVFPFLSFFSYPDLCCLPSHPPIFLLSVGALLSSVVKYDLHFYSCILLYFDIFIIIISLYLFYFNLHFTFYLLTAF